MGEAVSHLVVKTAHAGAGKGCTIDDDARDVNVGLGTSDRTAAGRSERTCPTGRAHAVPPGGVKLRSNFANSARAAAITWC